MSMIAQRFAERDHPLLIAFLVACDPDRETSVRAARAIIEGGADMLELGVPHSDPIADGPTIQRAHTRALVNGAKLDCVFSMVEELRRYSDLPIVLLMYYNMVMQRGPERFCREARAAGVDGLIVVDMPPEESEDVVRATEAAGIDEIFLVSETTSEERLRLILSLSRGFVYLVSTLGVTGARESLPSGIEGLIGRVKEAGNLPVALGFGISTPEQARDAALAGADGVIVGSALVMLLEEHLGAPGGPFLPLRDFVQNLKRAMLGVNVRRSG